MQHALYDPAVHCLSEFFALAPCNAQVALLERLASTMGRDIDQPLRATNMASYHVGRHDVSETYPAFTAMTVERCQGLKKAYPVFCPTRSKCGANGDNDQLGIIDTSMIATALTRGVRAAVIVGAIDCYLEKEGDNPDGPVHRLFLRAQALKSYFSVSRQDSF